MKRLLVVFCLAVLGSLAWMSVVGSLDRNVVAAGRALWPDPWFKATLIDLYWGFLMFFLWVAYKEPSWLKRGLWLVAILTLGNMATVSYLMLQVAKLKPGEPLENVLLRRRETGRGAGVTEVRG